MERAVAIKKLGKMLGKNFGYRVDPKAATAEQRKHAQELNSSLSAARKAAEDAMEARRKAILEADVEYQALVAAWREARDAASRNQSVAWNSYKITVGVTNSMFFHVKAQGDSWEDVIEQLTTKAAA